MASSVTIGEFSRMCHVSAKTLRYYHDIALLVPDAVDESTGYRRYSTDQVRDAHLIRRLRDLEMPLAEIRGVLVEPDGTARERALARHLDRMEAELSRTRDVVLSLRRLLGSVPAIPVIRRQSPAVTVLRTSARLARDEVGQWCGQTFPALYGLLAEHGLDPAGAGGATYSAEFFERDAGEVVAFVPVLPESAPDGDDRFAVLPRQRYAVAVHSGPFADCDLTYGWLGGQVAEHDTAVDGPIREVYLVGPDHTDDPSQFRTEICWPIQQGDRS
ncbi:MerR family transcriptional regulator [Frankia sp. CNm7]|uniref:MerR family transcriptional regulator n=1 Tax=Frankia nepalensis TaxID=1836974 RepID=A0A937RP59_9ACTN|nr:MerR family transcriptional regulator [Frankia nepalensis]MBL7495597.1 MerR family transcriptional regulator [Frankia nepalensis]MBL7508843.1 MerR family transcriptional regulator [Frankia nepalensis]MBL7522110.1 MerR family transcriptional regulator [Frankia nepalensis]MBL7630068.1 MerR family transcriptional regulator [Frankia nepalensis]